MLIRKAVLKNTRNSWLRELPVALGEKVTYDYEITPAGEPTELEMRVYEGWLGEPHPASLEGGE